MLRRLSGSVSSQPIADDIIIWADLPFHYSFFKNLALLVGRLGDLFGSHFLLSYVNAAKPTQSQLFAEEIVE